MITVRKSQSADSRSAKSMPTLDELQQATESHIGDVGKGTEFIASLLIGRGKKHDHTKMENMEEYHAALVSGKIKETPWYQKHITEERHHLKSHVPEDVNLIDVMEHLIDCTMAGLTRSGEIYDIDISPDVLVLACQNTVELIKNNTRVEDNKSDTDILNSPIGRDFMKSVYRYGDCIRSTEM